LIHTITGTNKKERFKNQIIQKKTYFSLNFSKAKFAISKTTINNEV